LIEAICAFKSVVYTKIVLQVENIVVNQIRLHLFRLCSLELRRTRRAKTGLVRRSLQTKTHWQVTPDKGVKYDKSIISFQTCSPGWKNLVPGSIKWDQGLEECANYGITFGSDGTDQQEVGFNR